MSNWEVRNSLSSLRRKFEEIYEDAKCAVSLSVRHEVFWFICDDLGHDVAVSDST